MNIEKNCFLKWPSHFSLAVCSESFSPNRREKQNAFSCSIGPVTGKLFLAISTQWRSTHFLLNVDVTKINLPELFYAYLFSMVFLYFLLLTLDLAAHSFSVFTLFPFTYTRLAAHNFSVSTWFFYSDPLYLYQLLTPIQ